MFEAHVIFSPSNTNMGTAILDAMFEAHVIFSPSNTCFKKGKILNGLRLM